MAEGLDFSEIVRRTMEANVRFYRGWLDLTVEYFRGITDALDPEAPTGEPDETGADAEPETGALVLEGEVGNRASGSFLVTNDLGRELTCELVTASLKGPDGKTVRPKVNFVPKSVRLEPGEQRVVQASVYVGKRLVAGDAYTGDVTIRGMEGFSIPLVLRRLHRVEGAVGSPIDRVAATASVGEEDAPASAKPRRKPARKVIKARAAKTVSKKATKTRAKK